MCVCVTQCLLESELVNLCVHVGGWVRVYVCVCVCVCVSVVPSE